MPLYAFRSPTAASMRSLARAIMWELTSILGKNTMQPIRVVSPSRRPQLFQQQPDRPESTAMQATANQQAPKIELSIGPTVIMDFASSRESFRESLRTTLRRSVRVFPRAGVWLMV